MKNKIISFALPLIALTTLSACSTPNAENLMADVDEATQKNGTLESATYAYSLSMEPGGIDQPAEGIFVSQGDDQYNWAHREYLGEGENFYQTAEIDGWHYELFWVDEPDFEPEWKRMEGRTLTAFDRMYPLFENTIEEEYLDEVEFTEENGKEYQVALKDSHLEDSLSETIQELEEQKTALEEVGDEQSVQTLEEEIAYIQEIEVSNPTLELAINEEGYLTKYVSSYTLAIPEEESMTTTIQYELTGYNLEDAASLLPEIE